jgi:hypothetical protein
MAVPAYYRSRHGHVFRVQRVQSELPQGRTRYVLRAVPIRIGAEPGANGVLEVAREISAADTLEKVRLGHAAVTPETTFDRLWQQLRLDLDGA